MKESLYKHAAGLDKVPPSSLDLGPPERYFPGGKTTGA
jgi:hypothetical protein